MQSDILAGYQTYDNMVQYKRNKTKENNITLGSEEKIKVSGREESL